MKVIKFINYIKEDAAAAPAAPATGGATPSNGNAVTSGAIVTAKVSLTPGHPSDNPADFGSGDIAAKDTGVKFDTKSFKKKKRKQKPSGKSYDNMYVTKFENFQFTNSIVNEESQFHTMNDIDNILDKIIDLGSFDALDLKDKTILKNFAQDDKLILNVLEKIKKNIITNIELLKKAPVLVTSEEAENFKNKFKKIENENTSLLAELYDLYNLDVNMFKKWLQENAPLKKEE